MWLGNDRPRRRRRAAAAPPKYLYVHTSVDGHPAPRHRAVQCQSLSPIHSILASRSPPPASAPAQRPPVAAQVAEYCGLAQACGVRRGRGRGLGRGPARSAFVVMDDWSVAAARGDWRRPGRPAVAACTYNACCHIESRNRSVRAPRAPRSRRAAALRAPHARRGGALLIYISPGATGAPFSSRCRNALHRAPAPAPVPALKTLEQRSALVPGPVPFPISSLIYAHVSRLADPVRLKRDRSLICAPPPAGPFERLGRGSEPPRHPITGGGGRTPPLPSARPEPHILARAGGRRGGHPAIKI
ncbi:hypothetical protein DFH11DRAFT_1873991 [Phellopilus nigrolimitatus]|nr:hypothetical protein DFH11DRAFT_1873991 [Phellopilus nigrolimitatus]